jgi:hypothetical protein
LNTQAAAQSAGARRRLFSLSALFMHHTAFPVKKSLLFLFGLFSLLAIFARAQPQRIVDGPTFTPNIINNWLLGEDPGTQPYDLSSGGQLVFVANAAASFPAVTGTVSAAANGTVASIDLRRYAGAVLTITGTWTGTITFQSGGGDSGFAPSFSLAAVSRTTTTGPSVTNTTVNGEWFLPGGAWTRVQITTAGTGTVTASLQPRDIAPLQVLTGINISGYNSAVPLTGNGVSGSGSPRVTIASDNTANINPWLVSLVGSAAQGAAAYHTLIAAATTNATSVKASAGAINSIHVTNGAAASRWLKIFNLAAAPTVGTSTPVLNLQIPAGWSGPVDTGPFGIRLGTGIAYAITGGQPLLDATAVTAGDVVLNLTFY